MAMQALVPDYRGPKLRATIQLRREDDIVPLLHVESRGDTHAELFHDSAWAMQHSANILTQRGHIQSDQLFVAVMVCGRLPDGKYFCLPQTLEGTLGVIVDQACNRLEELLTELGKQAEAYANEADDDDPSSHHLKARLVMIYATAKALARRHRRSPREGDIQHVPTGSNEWS